jgi:hypothetical protein
MSESLFTATSYFHPFPDPSEVFAKDVDLHAEFLLPLASVDLSHFNPQWRGRVHFVQPIEPYEGVVGEETQESHTETCRENWVGYFVDDDSRYTLATDFNFFLKRKLDLQSRLRQDEQRQLDVLREHYEQVRASFADHRDHFRRHGSLHWFANDEGEFDDDDRAPMVNDLGGLPGNGNWAALEFMELRWERSIHEDGDPALNPYPVLKGPGQFEFIGWAESYAYAKDCSCQMQLFFNPASRIARDITESCGRRS